MMMRRVLLAVMLLAVTMLAMAKPKPTQYGRGKGKVYIFGVSQELTDSVVYITFINEIDSLDLMKRTKFLPFRSEFSLQLKEYMEGTLKKSHQTTCVFYSNKRKNDTINATVIPTSRAINSELVKSNPNFMILTRLAPNMIGIPRKKVNSAAAGLETPSVSPPMMVEPDLDVPGTSDSIWNAPIPKALLKGSPSISLTANCLFAFLFSIIMNHTP